MGDIPKTVLISLYKTLVEPYFRYCNTTWGTCNSSLLDRLQALQNRAVGTVANVKCEDANQAKLLKELDWLNVRELIEYDTASLVYKIENNPSRSKGSSRTPPPKGFFSITFDKR